MTVLPFAVPIAAGVRIQVNDISGRLVETVVDEKPPGGYHSAVWNARAVPSGVYVVRMEASRQVFTKKVMLTR